MLSVNGILLLTAIIIVLIKKTFRLALELFTAIKLHQELTLNITFSFLSVGFMLILLILILQDKIII